MLGQTLNPVALVTGAASGLGAACAHQLARKATGGLILVDAAEDGIAKTADALETPPERVSMLPFDITDAEWWTRASEFITAQYGRLDWAVIGGGAPPASIVAAAGAKDWLGVASADLRATAQCLGALTPIMRRNTSGGAVVILSSLIGLKAEASLAAFASKADLLELVRRNAAEGAAHGVRVNALAQDAIDATTWQGAPMFEDLVREKGGERAALDAIAQMPAPLARMAATPDIARIAVMLVTEASPITGATLVVDGGYTL